MSAENQSWYIRGERNKPAGPFTPEDLIRWFQAGRLDPNTLCWRDGASQWLPLAHIEPFASAMRSTGTPLRRRRRTGVWIFAGIAVGLTVVLGIIAAFLFMRGGLGGGGLFGGFRLSDFEATRKWAMEQNLKLDAIRQEGNAIRLEDARKELERKLQEYVGKQVSWSLPVARVDNQVVVLEDQWTRKRGPAGKMFSTSECYLAIACESEPNADSMRFGVVFGGRAPVALTVGRQVSRSDAGKLTRGHHYTLRAAIEKITVSSDCILIRLSEPENTASQGEQESDSRAGGARPDGRFDPDNVKFEARAPSARPADQQDLEFQPKRGSEGQQRPDAQNAGKAYDEVLAKDPTNRPALIGRARCALKLKEYDGVIPLLLKVRPRDPDTTRFFVGELSAAGDELMEKNSWDGARHLFALALQLDPQNVSLLVQIGRACLQQDLPDDAIVHLDAALRLDPSNAGADSYRRAAFLKKGRPSDKAQPDLTKDSPKLSKGEGAGVYDAPPGRSAPSSGSAKGVKPPKEGAKRSAGSGGHPAPEPQNAGTLTGTWQATAGATFKIVDDGKTATIELDSDGGALQGLTGKLARRDDKPDSQSLKGSFQAVFRIDPRAKEYSVSVTATIVDDNQLKIRCDDWPVFDLRNGRYLNIRALNETWTRVGAGNAAAPGDGPHTPGPYGPGVTAPRGPSSPYGPGPAPGGVEPPGQIKTGGPGKA